MNIILICAAFVTLHARASLSIDVETFPLPCPGECPSSQPACVFHVHPIVNSKFYICIDDEAKLLTCPVGSVFFPEREECDPITTNQTRAPIVRSAVDGIRRHPNTIRRHELINFLTTIQERLIAVEKKVLGSSPGEIAPFLSTNESNTQRPAAAAAAAQQQQQQQKPLTVQVKPGNGKAGKQKGSSTATPPVTEKPEAKIVGIQAANQHRTTATSETTTTPTMTMTQSSKLDQRLQASKKHFQMPVNDFHSNFGINGDNRNGKKNNNNNNNNIHGSMKNNDIHNGHDDIVI